MKNNNKIKYSLISTLVLTILFGLNTHAFASAYGGGGGNNDVSLQIIKQVKLDGDSNFKDKVYIDLTDQNEKSKDIVFKITITNKGDKIDNLKYEDFLPSALNKISGDLTQDVGSLNTDETKTYEIKTSLKDDEVNRDIEFEKCVVNKVELRQDGDYEDNDVATVCFGNIKNPTQLPKTGFMPMTGFAGIGLISLGKFIKNKFQK